MRRLRSARVQGPSRCRRHRWLDGSRVGQVIRNLAGRSRWHGAGGRNISAGLERSRRVIHLTHRDVVFDRGGGAGGLLLTAGGVSSLGVALDWALPLSRRSLPAPRTGLVHADAWTVFRPSLEL